MPCSLLITLLNKGDFQVTASQWSGAAVTSEPFLCKASCGAALKSHLGKFHTHTPVTYVKQHLSSGYWSLQGLGLWPVHHPTSCCLQEGGVPPQTCCLGNALCQWRPGLAAPSSICSGLPLASPSHASPTKLSLCSTLSSQVQDSFSVHRASKLTTFLTYI